MSRRRNLPLTEEQLRRYSPVSIGRIHEARRRMGLSAAFAWWEATSVGSILHPDGSFSPVTKTDMRYVRGVVLRLDHRIQHGRFMGVAANTYQQWVKRWEREGFAHRCTRNAEITLVIQQGWLLDDCPWKDCPASAGITTSDRGERHLGARESPRAGAGNATSADDEARSSDVVSFRAESASPGDGVQRGEDGMLPWERNALGLVKDLLRAEEVRA